MSAAVIGAGPAGLTAAYELSKGSSDVTVFEASDCVGGLARSFPLWGHIVDLGPHRFFSKDSRVNELWLEVVGQDYFMVNRKTRILYQGKLFQYPLEAFDALGKLGLVEAVRCLGSYLRGKTGIHVVSERPAENLERWDAAQNDEAASFEDWVCHRFGRRLFEIFFKTYSEKLWGIPCHELDADFAAQRIKKFSLSAAIKSALVPGHRKQHRTLADEFAYPVGGTGMVYQRMAEAIRKRGGKVRLKTPIKKVLTISTGVSPSSFRDGESRHLRDVSSARRVVGVELTSGETVSCEHVISTMPLTMLVGQLDDLPTMVMEACQQLRFRNTVLVYLEVLGENPFPDQWIYVHSPELRFGRVTNFQNWKSHRAPEPRNCPTSYGEGSTPGLPSAILAMEYWCEAEDNFWKWNDEQIGALARKEIIESSLVKTSSQLGRISVFRIPKCYPVYRRGYREHLRIIREFLQTIDGLQAIGRYGSFKYNNQDHSILMGRLAAENLLHGTAHDLWGINTDYEYQEESSITESGLVNVS